MGHLETAPCRAGHQITATLIRSSVLTAMYSVLQQDDTLRKMLANAAQHTTSVSSQYYNMSTQDGQHCAAAALDIYMYIQKQGYKYDSRVILNTRASSSKGGLEKVEILKSLLSFLEEERTADREECISAGQDQDWAE